MTTELAFLILSLLCFGAAVGIGIVALLFMKFICEVIEEMGK